MFTLFALLAVLLFLILLIVTVLVNIISLVPYVPSPERVVKKMIKVARLKPKETVFDLGCGDGRLLILAEKEAEVKGVGFEIAPLVFLIALMRKIFARSKVKIQFQNFFHANFRKANVIFCYLLPGVMPRLAEKIKRECRRGTRIVSNSFHISDLTPYRVFERDRKRGIPRIYMYKV